MPYQIDTITTDSLKIKDVDVCSFTSQVYDEYPFIIKPTLVKTCPGVNDSSGQGLNLNGYKIVGSILLGGSTNYFEYLGTLTIKNGANVPVTPPSLKTSGTITWFPTAPVFITESLGLINRGWDTNGNPVYIEVEFVNFINVVDDDLVIEILLSVYDSDLNPTPLVGNIGVTVSFETEFFLFPNQDATFEQLP